MGRAMLTKSLIQFYVDGRGCVPSKLFDLTPNYGGDNEDNDDLLQQVLHLVPQPCSKDMTANFQNSTVATGPEKVSFHSKLKEVQCQRMFKLPHNYTHLTR